LTFHSWSPYKLKDPTWSASLRGVLGSVATIIFANCKKSQDFLAIVYNLFTNPCTQQRISLYTCLIVPNCHIYFQQNICNWSKIISHLKRTPATPHISFAFLHDSLLTTPFFRTFLNCNPFFLFLSNRRKTFILSALPADVEGKGNALRPLSFLPLDFRPSALGADSGSLSSRSALANRPTQGLFLFHWPLPRFCPKNRTRGHTARHGAVLVFSLGAKRL